MDVNQLLRKIPSVNALSEEIDKLNISKDSHVTRIVVSEVLNDIRKKILQGEIEGGQLNDVIMSETIKKIRVNNFKELQHVVNATGVVLHTNLGRSRLADDAIESMTEISKFSSNLEFDIQNGHRGDRYKMFSHLIAELTGAEDAIVVNNNAAAVMIVLNTLFADKELIISRGELVEIGGSFRIPDIITSTGGILREVGTTNKTHLDDYESAINENTGGFLKVHTSNYKLIGFTECPSDEQLAELAHKNNLPIVNDLGSGLMIDLTDYGFSEEPTIKQSLKYSDIITFSGDKLLGGPQAGIIAGKKEYIAKIKKNAMLRALRVDKITLSALISTLKLYRSSEVAKEQIPVLKMLTESIDDIKDKAIQLQERIKAESNVEAEVISDYSQVGGGAYPDVEIPTWIVAIKSPMKNDLFTEKLKTSSTPIIGRILNDKIGLDVRTIDESEFDYVVEGIKEATKKER